MAEQQGDRARVAQRDLCTPLPHLRSLHGACTCLTRAPDKCSFLCCCRTSRNDGLPPHSACSAEQGHSSCVLAMNSGAFLTSNGSESCIFYQPLILPEHFFSERRKENAAVTVQPSHALRCGINAPHRAARSAGLAASSSPLRDTATGAQLLHASCVEAGARCCAAASATQHGANELT